MTEFDISLKTLEPKKTRAKKRVGRPSLIRENIARAKDGLAPIVNPSKGRIERKRVTKKYLQRCLVEKGNTLYRKC